MKKPSPLASSTRRCHLEKGHSEGDAEDERAWRRRRAERPHRQQPVRRSNAPDDEPIQFLQIAEDFCGARDAERFVATTLIAEFHERHRTCDGGAEWYTWIGTVADHPKGLVFWVGPSSYAPTAIFGMLDDRVRAMGFATARATASPGMVNLSPLLYLGDVSHLESLRMI